MPATTLTTALATEFEPTGDQFCVDVLGGSCSLLRSNAAGGTFAPVGDITGRAVSVSNSASGAVYKLERTSPTTPTIRAYE